MTPHPSDLGPTRGAGPHLRQPPASTLVGRHPCPDPFPLPAPCSPPQRKRKCLACIKLNSADKVLGRMVHCPIHTQALRVRVGRGGGEAGEEAGKMEKLVLWERSEPEAQTEVHRGQGGRGEEGRGGMRREEARSEEG